jgi:xylulokinase
MQPNVVMGIDLGTSSVKALVWDVSRGRTLGLAQAVYGYKVWDGQRAEQDPDRVWRQVVRAVRRAMAEAGRPVLAAIGISGQMHGLALYDRAGRPCSNIITWEDHRADADVLRWMRRRAGRLLKRSGCGMAAGFAGATLVAMQRARDPLWRRARHWLLPGDWLRHRLADGGAMVTDPSNASSTGLFDTRRITWNTTGIERLGLDPDRCPSVEVSRAIVDRVGTRAAKACGLRAGTPLVTGVGDQPASMIGSGLCRAQDGLTLNLGTGSQVARVSATYVPGGGDCITFCFPRSGWSVLGAALSGGAALRWWRGVIAQGSAPGHGPDAAQLSRAAARIPPGAEGLSFIPMLAGSRAQPDARAAFVGLTHAHSLAHMTRAVMEGVILELYGLWRKQHGRRPSVITASGGGFASPTWRQIAADVFGAPLRMPTVPEQAALGAALLAGLGTRCYRDLADACAAVGHRRTIVSPRADATRLYHGLHRRRSAHNCPLV